MFFLTKARKRFHVLKDDGQQKLGTNITTPLCLQGPRYFYQKCLIFKHWTERFQKKHCELMHSVTI